MMAGASGEPVRESTGGPLASAKVESRVDGRALVVATLLLYFGCLGVAAWLGAPLPWTALGVPQMSPAFLDLHAVTSALDCARLGFDPVRMNPCDAFGRPMTYPRVWLLARHLGVSAAWTIPLGLVLGVAFLAACVASFRRLRAGEGAMLAVLLCSPSVMLLVERGNIDAVVFLLLLAAIALLARGGSRLAAGQAIVVLAAVLKLFPAVALPLAALRRPPTRLGRWMAAAGCVAFVAYAAVISEDLALIHQAVPQSASWSYGAIVLGLAFTGTSSPALPALYVALAVLAVAVGWRWAPRLRLPEPALATREGLAFVAGGAVYAGTFALGSNWCYRLAFLLLVVPQCFTWMRAGGAARRWAVATYAAVAAVLYLMLFSVLFPRAPMVAAVVVYVGTQVVTWALALLVCALLGAGLARVARAEPAGAAPA